MNNEKLVKNKGLILNIVTVVMVCIIVLCTIFIAYQFSIYGTGNKEIKHYVLFGVLGFLFILMIVGLNMYVHYKVVAKNIGKP